MFTPRPGDAERGRGVFARLACFTCHTSEEKASHRPLPRADLTDVERIIRRDTCFESILNPTLSSSRRRVCRLTGSVHHARLSSEFCPLSISWIWWPTW